MRRRIASILAVVLSPFAMIGASNAQDKPVKIGILNDQASVYSSITGPGSVAAARLAIEDVGGTMFGKPIELSPQSAHIRRLQHQLIEQHGLGSESRGEVPWRRVIVLPTRG